MVERGRMATINCRTFYHKINIIIFIFSTLFQGSVSDKPIISTHLARELCGSQRHFDFTQILRNPVKSAEEAGQRFGCSWLVWDKGSRSYASKSCEEMGVENAGRATRALTPFVCPPADRIKPCHCVQRDRVIDCGGVTQTQLDSTIKTIREVSGLAETDFMMVTRFDLCSAQLETLDLTSLFYLYAAEIIITGNERLKSIRGPRVDEGSKGRIIAEKELRIGYSSLLTEEGFGDILHYFDRRLKGLTIDANGITGKWGGKDSEYIRHISQFKNLHFINLAGNPIEELQEGAFYKHPHVTLGFRDCKISRIHDNALTFEATDRDDPMYIILSGNQLDEVSLNIQRNGVMTVQRGVDLYLANNQFKHLTAQTFEPFLKGHKANALRLLKNPIVCDESVKWLKDQRQLYERRVMDAYCENDPGRTVFNSDNVS